MLHYIRNHSSSKVHKGHRKNKKSLTKYLFLEYINISSSSQENESKHQKINLTKTTSNFIEEKCDKK